MIIICTLLDMRSKCFILRIQIQNLCLAFLWISLNRFEYLIFSLESNESEEDEVDKPPRKKRGRPKKKKAPQEIKVNFLSNCIN